MDGRLDPESLSPATPCLLGDPMPARFLEPISGKLAACRGCRYSKKLDFKEAAKCCRQSRRHRCRPEQAHTTSVEWPPVPPRPSLEMPDLFVRTSYNLHDRFTLEVLFG